MQPTSAVRAVCQPRLRLALTIAIFCCGLLAELSPSLAAGTLLSSADPAFSLTVDTRWPQVSGYRPVKFTVVPLVPTNSTTTLHMEFKPRSWAMGSDRAGIVFDLDLPPGAASASTTISAPALYPWQSYSLEVWVNGQRSQALSQSNVGFAQAGVSEGMPQVLVVGGMSDGSPLSALFPVANVTQQWPATGVNTLSKGGVVLLPTLHTALASELPSRWIDYSGLDFIILSPSDLATISSQFPDAWEAIRRWTIAGGTLIVVGQGQDPAELAEFDQPLGVPTDSAQWKPPLPADLLRPFSSPMQDNYGAPVYSAVPGGMAMTTPVGPVPTATVATPAPPDTQSPPAVPTQPPFVWRSLGMGMVVSTEGNDLAKWSSDDWKWLLNTLGEQRWLWFLRHGLSLYRQNDQFWEWMIPGVGMVPVTGFRILITLFAVLIGPVLFLWLRRQGRLNLLLLIVPACALLVTGVLFSYALLSDGLDVRVRARSFTQIDQRSKSAACWARISYYAGLVPSGGLVFSRDVAVFPLQPEGTDSHESAGRSRSVVMDDDYQRLASGWLAPRTLTQFVTVRSRSTEVGLDVATQGGVTRVTNRLGVAVRRLLLNNSDDTLLTARDISAGATVELAPATLADEQDALKQLAQAQATRLPVGFDTNEYGAIFGIRGYRNRWYGRKNLVQAASPYTSLLEKSLTNCVDPKFTAGLAPRSYLAVVDQSPEIEWGVDQPRIEEGLNFVYGQW